MASDDPNDPRTYGINLPTAMVIGAFCAIAWVNTIELQFRIWLGFKRRSGLYFWSLVLSSWGCAIHALGFLFLDFLIIRQPNAVGVMIGVSWWCMVTGQALVLYSRLHLVVRDKRKIRWVLVMIITNFCILHLPIMVVSQAGYSLPYPNKWLDVYNVYEKVQMTGFTIQETIISGLYLYEANKILRPGKVFQKKRTSEVLKHLIWVNGFVIFLDAALLATEFANLFDIQTVFKAAIYSVKLRFEFVVLNQLMDIVGGRSASAFSLSESGTHASGPHDNSRPSHSIPLGSVNDRSRSHPGDAYSVFAKPGSVTGPSGREKGEGVLRTTEVYVHSSPAKKEEEDEFEIGMARTTYDDMKKGRPTSHARAWSPSRSSSEVEFAAEGVHPS